MDREFDHLHSTFQLSEIEDNDIKSLVDAYLEKGADPKKMRDIILDKAKLEFVDSNHGVLNKMEFDKRGYRNMTIALVVSEYKLHDALEKEFGFLEESVKLQEQFITNDIQTKARKPGNLTFQVKYDAKKIAAELADRFLKKPYGEYKNTDEDREDYSTAVSDYAMNFEKKINKNALSWFRDFEEKMHSDLSEISVNVEVGSEDPADAYFDVEFSLEYAIMAKDLVNPILKKLNSL